MKREEVIPPLIFALSFAFSSAFFYLVYLLIYPFLRPQPTGAGGAPGVLPSLAVRILALASSSPAALYFYLVFVVIVFLNEFTYIFLALYHRTVDKKRRSALTTYRLVSVIIPAFNEEKTIEKTLRAVLDSNYPNLEVIVVNDGSTDKTAEVVTPYVVKSRGMVRLINRPNGGKAAAINTGLLFARGDVIVCVDADTIVTRSAISNLVSYLKPEEVVGAAGNVKVGNRVNLLTRLQALEYVRGLNIRRRAFDVLNTILVIPGAIGAFKREAVSLVGTYTKDTVTEDMDETFKLVKTRLRVVYASRAVAYTEAPSTFKGFLRQRKRWYGGILQVLKKHGTPKGRFGTFSVVGYPYAVLSMFFLPFVELTTLSMTFAYVVAGFALGITRFLYGVALFTLINTAVEYCLSGFAVGIEGESPSLVSYTVIYVWFYRFLLDAIRLRSIIEVLLGRLTWSKTRVERMGNLPSHLKSLATRIPLSPP